MLLSMYFAAIASAAPIDTSTLSTTVTSTMTSTMSSTSTTTKMEGEKIANWICILLSFVGVVLFWYFFKTCFTWCDKIETNRVEKNRVEKNKKQIVEDTLKNQKEWERRQKELTAYINACDYEDNVARPARAEHDREIAEYRIKYQTEMDNANSSPKDNVPDQTVEFTLVVSSEVSLYSETTCSGNTFSDC